MLLTRISTDKDLCILTEVGEHMKIINLLELDLIHGGNNANSTEIDIESLIIPHEANENGEPKGNPFIDWCGTKPKPKLNN